MNFSALFPHARSSLAWPDKDSREDLALREREPAKKALMSKVSIAHSRCA